jgi:hypothetical protein
MKITVKIYLPDYLVDYLKGIFPYEKGELKISQNHDIGRMFNSLLTKPIKEKFSANLNIIIPSANRNNLFSYNYMSISNQLKFKDYVELHFNLEFHYWLLRAQEFNIALHKAYELFFVAKKIDFNHKNIETVKKKDFRFRKKTENEFYKVCNQLIHS